MTAKEFVKQYGWDDARVCILNCACPEDRWLMRHGELISDDDFDELKQLVDAWELIGNFGGLFSLVCTIDKECPCPEFGQLEYYDENRNIVLVDMPKIEQAIELVESVK